MKQPSVMKHDFSQIPHADIPRSSFDRSCGTKTTFDGGYLVPVFLDEALPGDTFNLGMSAFARLATPLHPYMDNMFLSSFFFAVPIRLIWDNWQKFNGEQIDPGDSTDFLTPTMTSPNGLGYLSGTLSDYMGIPTERGDLEHSALFHRAYNLIWNEWFRDQNLQDSLPVPRGDGPDDPDDYTLQRRGKRHDYFTSALPWPQKNDSVDLPLGLEAPIRTDHDEQDEDFYANTVNDLSGRGLGVRLGDVQSGGGIAGSSLYADLTNATAATINQLRQAFQIQKLYERDARGGTRYTEIIRSHFGVSSPDARLQRPEYLGGGTSNVRVQAVAQTSATLDGGEPAGPSTPQGNLAAFATMSFSGHGFTKSFTEHCLILGMVSVRADLNYQQGLNRMWSRQTRWDYYWPALSHIGEQAILNKEIYAYQPGQDEEVFGYQERYAEYRYKPSIITGKFRSNDAQSLDTWHLAQDFANLPTLNSQFIEDNPPIDRIIAVQDEPHFIFDAYFKLKCARPMPMYGVPGLIDHF